MADEKRAREALDSLDSIAREHDIYEYGLPLHDDEVLGRMLDVMNSFAESSKAKEGPVETGSLEYWKSRAETAELKVLTFHEEIVKEGQTAPCQCVCHKVGLLGFMCCPCTTRIFQAVADKGGNNVAIRSKVSHVPEQRMEVGQEGRERNQRGDSVPTMRDDSRTETGANREHSVAAEPTGQAQADICPRWESHYSNFLTQHCIADPHKWHSEEGREWPREAQETPKE